MIQKPLVMLRNKVRELSLYFVEDFRNPTVARLLFSTLLFLTLAKIMVLWRFTNQVLEHHQIILPTSWIGKVFLAPSFLADWNVNFFFALAAAFIVLASVVRPNYVTTTVYFFLALNLYVIYLPFASGADIVTFMIALWFIPVATRPALRSEFGQIVQKALFNLGILLCKLQIVFIYAISGGDKLQSSAWRSGEAFDYITHLSTLFNPALDGLFDNPTLKLVLTWAVIIFELSFVVLVWFPRTRLPILAIGIIFHLFIWTVISLPDFAAIMMTSYLVFLKDSDLARFRKLIKLSLP